MKFLSPAKINLCLEILGRRPDGYHEIQSIMSRIDLQDEIELLPEGRGIALVTAGEEVPDGKDNLVCRAARAFFQEIGEEKGLRIRLEKRIPVAAGLGGGSSTAATVLLGLNELFHAGMSRECLIGLGAKIGADVPFFIFGGRELARGIGEKLTAVRLPPSFGLVLLVPPFRISTVWSYGAYDQLPPAEKRVQELKASYPHLNDLASVLRNDLEIVASVRYPEIPRMKGALLAQGAEGALMSGSGPVVYGLFPSKPEAVQAGRRIGVPAGWKALVAKGI
jgi:4-diphosphocytidyl-2-C-methyl-D-erythritol kinase